MTIIKIYVRKVSIYLQRFISLPSKQLYSLELLCALTCM